MNHIYSNDIPGKDIILNFKEFTLSNNESQNTPNHVCSINNNSAEAGISLFKSIVPNEWSTLKTGERLSSLFKQAKITGESDWLENIKVLSKQAPFKPLLDELQSIKVAGDVIHNLSTKGDELLEKLDISDTPIPTSHISALKEGYITTRDSVLHAFNDNKLQAIEIETTSTLQGKFSPFVDAFEFNGETDLNPFLTQAAQLNESKTLEWIKSGKLQKLNEFNRQLSPEEIGLSISQASAVHAAGALTSDKELEIAGLEAIQHNINSQLLNMNGALSEEQRAYLTQSISQSISQLDAHHASNLLGNDLGGNYTERATKIITDFSNNSRFEDSVSHLREQLFALTQTLSNDEIGELKQMLSEIYPNEGLSFPSKEFKEAFENGLDKFRHTIDNMEFEPEKAPTKTISPVMTFG